MKTPLDNMYIIKLFELLDNDLNVANKEFNSYENFILLKINSYLVIEMIPRAMGTARRQEKLVDQKIYTNKN